MTDTISAMTETSAPVPSSSVAVRPTVFTLVRRPILRVFMWVCASAIAVILGMITMIICGMAVERIFGGDLVLAFDNLTTIAAIMTLLTLLWLTKTRLQSPVVVADTLLLVFLSGLYDYQSLLGVIVLMIVIQKVTRLLD